jgi:hypothetical protein
MEIPWYINRHTLISRKRDGKPRMIGGQFVLGCKIAWSSFVTDMVSVGALTFSQVVWLIG